MKKFFLGLLASLLVGAWPAYELARYLREARDARRELDESYERGDELSRKQYEAQHRRVQRAIYSP